MKIACPFWFLACLLLPFSLAVADDIIILKSTETEVRTDYYEFDPGTPTVSGKPVIAHTSVNTSYLIIDRTSGQYVRFSYDALGAKPVVKEFSISPASSLSGIFDTLQPLKAPGSWLWNFSRMGPVHNNLDLDSDTVIDGQSNRFFTRYYTGTGTPLALSKTRSMPNVPRAIAGKEVYSYTETDSLDDASNSPHRLFSKGAVTVSMALDTATTTAANLTAITPSTAASADLSLPAATPQPAGTLNNALARVHAALYALGYRKGPI